MIWKNDDLEGGYIEYRNISQDEDGKEILVVRGKFLTGYMNKNYMGYRELKFNVRELPLELLIIT